MWAVAEIDLGERTVLEYLRSPLRKAFHEAGRERKARARRAFVGAA